MTITQVELIHILSEQLFGVKNASATAADIPALLRESEQQTVFPLVYSAEKERLRAALSEDERSEAEQKYYACLAQAVRSRDEHARLHRLLSEHSISYVILKGQASARYYPDPMLRTMGDVDFLVRREDLETVDALLRQEGFCRTNDAETHAFHWAYQKNGTELEMHWDVPGIPETEGDVIRGMFSDLLRRAEMPEKAEETWRVPSTFHHGLILLLHTISHLTAAGVGLRHLCDWLVFENSLSEEAFRSCFERPLREIGLWQFAVVLTATGIRYFGCEKRDFCAQADPELCAAFLEDIFDAGNFGRKDAARKSQDKLLRDGGTPRVEKGRMLRNVFANLLRRAGQEDPKLAEKPLRMPLALVRAVGFYVGRILSGERRYLLDRRFYARAHERRDLYARLRLFETQSD